MIENYRTGLLSKPKASQSLFVILIRAIRFEVGPPILRMRKTLLTAAPRKRVFEMLHRGHTIKTSGALDFSERAYHEWCQKDTSFAAQSFRARATGRMRIVDSILADKDWRARAWYLERCYPAEFS